MKPLSDTDLIDYLKCPAMWYSRRKGKFKPTPDTVMDYFNLYINNDEGFAQWQIDNSSKLFYSSRGLRTEFVIAQACAERLLIDPLVAGFYDQAETVDIDTIIHDVPFQFRLPGVDMEKQTVCIAILGPYRLSTKKAYTGKSGNPQWIHWVIADQYPALAHFYSEALKNQLCLDCKPFLSVVQKDNLPDFIVYDCHEIAQAEETRVYWAILEMQSYINGEHSPDNLINCGICEFCKTTKKLTEPEILTYTV